MSQFSRKYYNLDYKRNEVEKFTAQEEGVWEFWRVWGLFEYSVIALLIAILLCVCFKDNGATNTTTQKIIYTPTPVKSVEPKEVMQQTHQTLGEAYPKKVLPSSVVPKGAVTIEDYLYFADDTQAHYPDFIDPATHRLIKEKAPKCYKPECPLQDGVSVESLNAYTRWVSQQSQKNLHLSIENQKFFLH